MLGNNTDSRLLDGRIINRLFYGSGHLHQINLMLPDGAVQELTDVQGRVVWAAQYQVWGEAEMLQTGTGSAWQYSEPLPQVEQPFRFQGQQYDAETGLHYNRFRYYDPAIGRFISQDPIGLLGGR
ncbi:RHS repeat-associated core domain-containing protein [Massilia sp. W12]|uniref:RHS repeat-associated core domain-containing protein n=1 Tax=Massilia sp. W12 TaxID=3126507 RepID=UPI0030D47BF1